MILVSLTLSYVLVGCSQSSTTSADQHTQPKKQTQQKKPNKQNQTKKTTNNQGSQSSQTQSPSSANKTTPTNANQKVIVDKNPSGILVLVNKTHKLPDGYVPNNLIIPNVAFPYSGNYEKMHMRAVAAHALETMFNAAKKDGIKLYAQSGYRSFKRQTAIFAANVKRYGEKQASRVSAHPGTSEHQTGLAMDITSSDVNDLLIQKFGDTKEGKWVALHAHEYGFIIRYPKGKEQITGYEYEPWHLRYVGKKVATYIYNHHITLEKYIESQKKN